MNATDELVIGHSRGQVVRSPLAPKNHAVGAGLTIALCGASVQASGRKFRPTVHNPCRRCLKAYAATAED